MKAILKAKDIVPLLPQGNQEKVRIAIASVVSTLANPVYVPPPLKASAEELVSFARARALIIIEKQFLDRCLVPKKITAPVRVALFALLVSLSCTAL